MGGLITIRTGYSLLGDCPEDTEIMLSHEGEPIDGIWRYYMRENQDNWSVKRGAHFYSEMPPMGIPLTWRPAPNNPAQKREDKDE